MLFLDEFPLFRTDVIEALRQPLENGEVAIARRDESVPCRPAAWWCWRATRAPAATTTPAPGATAAPAARSRRRDYRRKVTGPITDRIDITRHL